MLPKHLKIYVFTVSLSKRVRQWQWWELFLLAQVEESTKLLFILFVFVEELRLLEICVPLLAPS